MIELRNFRHTYLAGTPLAVEAIRGLSVQIEPGERVAVVGPSRSGKSTVLHALAHLVRVASGQVFVGGEDIAGKGYDRAALRRRIGIVFQEPESQLIEAVVGQDVAFGPTAAGLSAAETRQRVEASLDAVGLPYRQFRLRYTYALSGGQSRRVALAGVLAMDTPVLVLDEPTAGLDPQGRHDLIAQLERLLETANRTLIVASSSLTDAALLADRVVVLAAGRLVRDLSREEALRAADELQGMGVGVPDVVRLAHRLRSVLPALPTTVTSTEALADAVVATLGEAR